MWRRQCARRTSFATITRIPAPQACSKSSSTKPSAAPGSCSKPAARKAATRRNRQLDATRPCPRRPGQANGPPSAGPPTGAARTGPTNVHVCRAGAAVPSQPTTVAMGLGVRRDDELIYERPMNQKIKTFLMFDGQCEEAMNFYVSLFRDAAVTNIRRYGAGEQGAEGSVM